MTDEYLHDLKRIAKIAKMLMDELDKLHRDVVAKTKGENHAGCNHMGNTELGADSSGPVATRAVITTDL